MKKVICLIMLLIQSLIYVSNVVYAQNEDLVLEQNEDIYLKQDKDKSLQQLPPNLSNFYTRLNYVRHELVQEHEETYEYSVLYTIPYEIPRDFVYFYPFLYHRLPYTFVRGLTYNDNSYQLYSTHRFTDYTNLVFRITLRKDMVNIEYPDGDVTPFFTDDMAMYVGADFLQDVFYKKGFDDGVKSITGKYTSYVLKWTLPFVSLVIISSVYIAIKKEWFKK